jgi:hypothetical protein
MASVLTVAEQLGMVVVGAADVLTKPAPAPAAVLPTTSETVPAAATAVTPEKIVSTPSAPVPSVIPAPGVTAQV